MKRAVVLAFCLLLLVGSLFYGAPLVSETAAETSTAEGYLGPVMLWHCTGARMLTGQDGSFAAAVLHQNSDLYRWMEGLVSEWVFVQSDNVGSCEGLPLFYVSERNQVSPARPVFWEAQPGAVKVGETLTVTLNISTSSRHTEGFFFRGKAPVGTGLEECERIAFFKDSGEFLWATSFEAGEPASARCSFRGVSPASGYFTATVELTHYYSETWVTYAKVITAPYKVTGPATPTPTATASPTETPTATPTETATPTPIPMVTNTPQPLPPTSTWTPAPLVFRVFLPLILKGARPEPTPTGTPTAATPSLRIVDVVPPSPQVVGREVRVLAEAINHDGGIAAVRFFLNSAVDGSTSGTWWNFANISCDNMLGCNVDVSLTFNLAPADFPQAGTHLIVVDAILGPGATQGDWYDPSVGRWMLLWSADDARQRPYTWVMEMPTVTVTPMPGPTP